MQGAGRGPANKVFWVKVGGPRQEGQGHTEGQRSQLGGEAVCPIVNSCALRPHRTQGQDLKSLKVEKSLRIKMTRVFHGPGCLSGWTSLPSHP